jgi:hypothetical protein
MIYKMFHLMQYDSIFCTPVKLDLNHILLNNEKITNRIEFHVIDPLLLICVRVLLSREKNTHKKGKNKTKMTFFFNRITGKMTSLFGGLNTAFISSSNLNSSNVSMDGISGGGVITANGVDMPFTGRSVSVVNNKVFIDGVEQKTGDDNNSGPVVTVHVTINGDCNSIENAHSVSVKGNVTGHVTTSSGDVTVGGSTGQVSTMSGSVEVEQYISGKVNTMSGNVTASSIRGSVETMSGSIKSKKHHKKKVY